MIFEIFLYEMPILLIILNHIIIINILFLSVYWLQMFVLWLLIYTSIYLSIYISIYLSIYLSIYTIYPSKTYLQPISVVKREKHYLYSNQKLMNKDIFLEPDNSVKITLYKRTPPDDPHLWKFSRWPFIQKVL